VNIAAAEVERESLGFLDSNKKWSKSSAWWKLSGKKRNGQVALSMLNLSYTIDNSVIFVLVGEDALMGHPQAL